MQTIAVLRVALAAMSCVLFSGTSLDSRAQGYPSKPLRIIVPFAAGGGADRMARLVSQKLTEGLKQPAVVDFRAGAAGRVGTEQAAKAPPDGYTLLLGVTSAVIIAPVLYGKLAYDVQKDLAAVALLASNAYVLVVHPLVPARSVKELIGLARASPGKLNYASSGAGGPAHLSAELFQSVAKVKLVHVPYKGSAPGTMALIGGETDLMFSNIQPAVPAIQSGRLRALAITSAKRSSLLPDVPSAPEAGLGDFSVETIYGIMVPAGTPREIVTRLNELLVKGFDTPDTKSRLIADGSEILTSTPEEFDRLIRNETAKWGKIIRQAGIKPE
jgi:tripartite-type tricarboxylate transporter receptor subunit TctC